MNTEIKTDKLPWVNGRVSGFAAKELISKNNTTLRLVRVSPHAKYPVHSHPDKTEFAYVTKGQLQIHIDGKDHNANPGSFYIFADNTPHSIINSTDQECELLIGAITNDTTSNTSLNQVKSADATT